MSHKENILVHIVHHPVKSCKVTIVEIPFRNQTLAEIKHQFTNSQEVIVVLEGKEIEPFLWDVTKVSAGNKVVIGPAVCDPVTMYLFGMTLGATLWYVATTLALMYAFSYLGGMLFGQSIKQPTRGTERERGQSFSWNPHTTQTEGIPHPMCYGTNMHHGNIVARWTDVDESGSELLYMILDYGTGPIEGRGANIVYLNDQPSGNFSDVTLQDRLGILNQTCMTGFEKNKLEYRPQGAIITNDDGPLTWVTPNNFFDDIEYTLEFPRGLWHYTDIGDRVSHSIDVKVEIAERDEGDWHTIFDDTIEENQFAPVYKAYTVNDHADFNCVHGKQYDLKITKTSADKGTDKYGDELRLRSVREVVDIAFTRPGKVLLGITALATERLSGNINVKWVADDKLVQWYNGTVWAIGFKRNRAWVALDQLTQPVISGDGNGGGAFTVERYEGLDPSKIDLAFFYEWAQWCAYEVSDGNEGLEERMPCDIIVDYQTDVWSLVYEISQIGRMYPYWQGNILTGWVDKAVTIPDDVIDLITMDNTMIRSWRSGWAGYGEMAGGAEIFYRDSLHGYERKTLPVSNENAGLYNRIVAIEGTGVTGRAMATRVGNHALTRNKLIKNINSMRMYKDALRYSLGSVVCLQSKIPNWGDSYRVISSIADTVTLDRTCTANVDDILYIRSYDEANKEVVIDSYTVDSVSGAVVTIADSSGWEVTPVKDNIVAIGVDGKIKLRRIIKMTHMVDNYFDVELETYDTDLFDSDGIEPDIDNPDYVWPAPYSTLVKPITNWEVTDLINQMLPPQPDIEIPWLSNCDWTGSGGDTVTWSKRDATKPILFRYRGTSYEITADNTTDEFIYWDPDATTEFKHHALVSVALDVGHWLMCVNKDGVVFPANAMQIIHGGVIQAGTIIATQIVIGGINALSLLNAPAEAGADVTGGHTAADIAGQGNLATTDENELSLANFNEKSVDSLVDGTYAKMLAVWKHGSDPAKMDLSKGFAASITTAQIGLLAVHTAQINNLSVDTLQIANEAVTLMVAAYTAGTETHNNSTQWWEAQTITITTTGSPVMLVFSVQWEGRGDNGINIRIERDDDTTIYEANMSSLAQYGNPFCAVVVNTPSAALHTYDLDIQSTAQSIGDPELSFRHRSIVAKEVKK